MGRYSGLSKKEESVYEFMAEALSPEAALVVRQHSFAAAIVGGIAGIPGVGTTGCVMAQTAIVFSMYVRVNRALGIRLSDNKMKSLASAVLGNIATNAGGYIAGMAVSTVFSFVPIAGTSTSAMIMAGLGYATATVAALVYGKALIAMTRHGIDIASLSEEELKNAVKEEIDKRDVSKDMKNFCNEYKREKRAGNVPREMEIDLEKYNA